MGYGMNHKIKMHIRTGTVLCLAGLFFVFSGGKTDSRAWERTLPVYGSGFPETKSPEMKSPEMKSPEWKNPESEAPSLTLNAGSAVLMDAQTGRVLYGKEENAVRPMASTTKIMTCILALEQGNLTDSVQISSYAASMPDVQLNVKAGEEYSLEDLLYSLMLESHNDAAVAVAEHIGGSVENFARLMNQKARDIGCEHTNFVTPNGLDGVSKEDGSVHATTAEDLARIMRYCICQSPKREDFLRITRTSSRTITDVSGKRSFYLGNHNALLSMLPEALSGKTGFTSEAGYCYVAALRKEKKEFTVALLGCGWPPHKTYKWEDMRKLTRYAFENYRYYEIFDREKQFPQVKVQNGKTDCVSLTMDLKPEEKSLKILLREGEQPEIHYEYPERMEAPVGNHEVVGRVTYSVGGQKIAEYPIYTAEGAERIDFAWCLSQILLYFAAGF